MKTGTDLEPGTRGELVRKKTYVGPPFEALNVRDAAAIIAGCSVGGGFLALPTVRAEPPPPFPPSWPHMPSLHEVFPRLPADPRGLLRPLGDPAHGVPTVGLLYDWRLAPCRCNKEAPNTRSITIESDRCGHSARPAFSMVGQRSPYFCSARPQANAHSRGDFVRRGSDPRA